MQAHAASRLFCCLCGQESLACDSLLASPWEVPAAADGPFRFPPLSCSSSCQQTRPFALRMFVRVHADLTALS